MPSQRTFTATTTHATTICTVTKLLHFQSHRTAQSKHTRNFADALTQHLPAPTLSKHMNRLGLLDVTSVMNLSVNCVTSSHTVTSYDTSFVTRWITSVTRMTLWLTDFCSCLSFLACFLARFLPCFLPFFLCFLLFPAFLLVLPLLFHSCALALN